MKNRSKIEKFFDIAIGLIPVASGVYHGRKGHKEGFIEASEIYEKKYRKLIDEKRQIRKDVLGERQVFICPESWDAELWQKKMDLFVKEQFDAQPSTKELMSSFLQFCIDTFPKRRLAETLEDLKVVHRVISATSQELAELAQDDIELAIDFLCFYREAGDIKKLKEELVALLPSTNGCNFLVLGKTGVGKSSLLNSLLSTTQFATGTGRPVTKKGIFESNGKLDGIKVRVFDSWGLEAGEVEEWRMLLADAMEKHDLSHKIEDWFHAVVYCVNAGGHRIEDVDKEIVRMLLDDDLYVVVALTKSDQCSEEDSETLRKTLCAMKECKKLRPENVIDVCVGAETRAGKSKPFGINEVKRAILKNYRKTIEAQVPKRCIYLGLKEVSDFKKETEKWIDTREWKYDDDDNNRPLKEKCDRFLKSFMSERFSSIVQHELEACAKYGRNLATALKLDDMDVCVPNVTDSENLFEKIGDCLSKTFNCFFGWLWDSDQDQEERDRLNAMLSDFCKSLNRKIEEQKTAICAKVREVMQ